MWMSNNIAWQRVFLYACLPTTLTPSLICEGHNDYRLLKTALTTITITTAITKFRHKSMIIRHETVDCVKQLEALYPRSIRRDSGWHWIYKRKWIPATKKYKRCQSKTFSKVRSNWWDVESNFCTSTDVSFGHAWKTTYNGNGYSRHSEKQPSGRT